MPINHVYVAREAIISSTMHIQIDDKFKLFAWHHGAREAIIFSTDAYSYTIIKIEVVID